MAINIGYEPDFNVVGRAAYEAGVGQRREADRAREDRLRSERQQIMAQLANSEANRRHATDQTLLNAELQVGRDTQLHEQRIEEGVFRSVMAEETEERNFTTRQNRELETIRDAMTRVNNDPRLSPQEKAYAISQLQAKRDGYIPRPPEKKMNIIDEIGSRMLMLDDGSWVFMQLDGKLDIKPPRKDNTQDFVKARADIVLKLLDKQDDDGNNIHTVAQAKKIALEIIPEPEVPALAPRNQYGPTFDVDNVRRQHTQARIPANTGPRPAPQMVGEREAAPRMVEKEPAPPAIVDDGGGLDEPGGRFGGDEGRDLDWQMAKAREDMLNWTARIGSDMKKRKVAMLKGQGIEAFVRQYRMVALYLAKKVTLSRKDIEMVWGPNVAVPSTAHEREVFHQKLQKILGVRSVGETKPKPQVRPREKSWYDFIPPQLGSGGATPIDYKYAEQRRQARLESEIRKKNNSLKAIMGI